MRERTKRLNMKTSNKEKTYLLVPVKENVELELPHFPTKMQAVIFRVWEMVDVGTIAKVLNTTEEIVRNLAEDMGLPPQKNTKEWHERGYITIIKSLWHLLPYEQLCQMLGWDEERLAYTLKEDDVLHVKLGDFKPHCEPVFYAPLTESEKEITKKIKSVISQQANKELFLPEKLPFDFIDPIYPTKRKITAQPDKYDVVLSENWSVSFDDDSCEILTAVDMFCESICEDWGISIGKNTATDKVIKINITDDKKEYHKLVIKNSGIEIFAEKTGVLRALTLLIDKARAEGGPYYNEEIIERNAVFHTRFLYSYCGLYGQAFDVPPEVSYPEKMLKAYAELGVNGIWTQAVLYKLIEFPFEPSVSEGWQNRLENLKQMVKTAKKYGIKVYLYINEPRNMPLAFFDKYPELKGHEYGGYASICTSSEGGKKYLFDSVSKLCSEVPDLGGLFIISRSENRTNCYSHIASFDSVISSSEVNCPRCAQREGYEVVAEANKIIADAAHSVNPDIKVIVWPWAWTGPLFTTENIEKTLKIIPDHAAIMSVSEHDKPLLIGGVKNAIRDYSMSQIGPSDFTKNMWKMARESNHETFAKMQINTTWECSTVPSLPVYQLVIDHIENVKKEKVSGLMLGWTLGGYPSANLKVASGSFFKDLNNNSENQYESILKSIYREDYETVKKATDLFCEGFKEFPFNQTTLYNAPHNAGVSNLLYEKPSGFKSTMTCYSYDDLGGWRTNYPEDIFENQYRKISEKWEEGLKLIENMEVSEFKDVSEIGYSLFKSTYDQIRFVRARDRYLNNDEPEKMKKIMVEVAKNELALAKKVYEIMRRNPSIGYEAANHYYFNQTMILEKMINCAYLIEKFEG